MDDVEESSIPYRKSNCAFIETTSSAWNQAVGTSSSQDPTSVVSEGKAQPIEATEVASSDNVADKRNDNPVCKTVPAVVASIN